MMQIACGRIIDAFSLLRKAGAMAWAVPGVLLGIPFQRAAHMGTSLGCGGQQADGRLKSIDDQLRAEDCAGRRNTSAKGLVFPCTRSLNSMADTIEDVIPHLLNPVATYKFDVEEE